METKEIIRHTILTNDWTLITRDEYEDWCADCGDIEPTDSGYYEFAVDETECNMDSDMYEIRHNYNFPVVVEGRLGLWWGKPEIEPKRFESVESAIRACVGNDDCVFSVDWVDGVLEVSVSHHDGTNHFTISQLSAKGLKMGENAALKDYHKKKMFYLYDVA